MSDMSKQEEARLMAEAVKLVQNIPGLEPLVLDSALAEMDVEAVLNLPKDLYDEVMQNPANLRHVIDLYKVKAHSLTKESIPEMTQDHLNRLLELKEPRSIVNKILFQPTDLQRVIPETVVEVVDPEVVAQDAQAEADRVAAEAETVRIEAERVAAEAETVRLAAEAEAVRVAAVEAAKVVAPKTKIIREYQSVDGRGNPVGQPTHLEADSMEEMLDKMQAAHMSATAAFERMKNKKTIAAAERQPAPIVLPSDEELLEAAKSLDSEKDPTKRLAAIKKIASAETLKATQEAQKIIDRDRGSIASSEFIRAHTHDFYPCEANAKALGKYLHDNKLVWSVSNLELAFQEIEHQLATKPVVIKHQVVEPVVEKIVEKIEQVTPAANPVAAPATVVAPVIAPVATVVAPTPVAQAPAANIPVVAPKIPASGLEPGSLHGGASGSRFIQNHRINNAGR